MCTSEVKAKWCLLAQVERVTLSALFTDVLRIFCCYTPRPSDTEKRGKKRKTINSLFRTHSAKGLYPESTCICRNRAQIYVQPTEKERMYQQQSHCWPRVCIINNSIEFEVQHMFDQCASKPTLQHWLRIHLLSYRFECLCSVYFFECSVNSRLTIYWFYRRKLSCIATLLSLL